MTFWSRGADGEALLFGSPRCGDGRLYPRIHLLAESGGFTLVKAVGRYMATGWREPIMFYTFKCRVHGLVCDYAHGYAGRLECPICMEEIRVSRLEDTAKDS